MNIDVQVLLSEGQLSPRDLEKGDAKELVSPVLDRLEEDHIVTVESLGKNCHLPGSFQVWPPDHLYPNYHPLLCRALYMPS